MGAHISHDASSQDVLDALRRIVQALRESSRRAEQELGISGAQLFVLEKLADAPSQSLNDLAARTFTHQSSVSTVVARLVEQGLVSRQRSSGGDSRKLELVLTGRGRRMATRTTGAAQERLIASIQQIPAESRAQLSALLQRVVGGMNTPARQPRMFFDDTRRRRLRRNG
jgi:DNA-binding MarR family transcriptional regulator